MSDFFINSQNTFEKSGNQNSVNNFWDEQSKKSEETAQKRLENRQRYGVELTDEEYSQINNLIADSDNYDEEAHKIGSAILYSKEMGVPVSEAYTNLDTYNEALWGKSEKTQNYKSAFTAISDMFVIGNNGLKLGSLGNQLKEAEMSNDQELIETIQAQIDALESDNELRQDNAPRSWITEALKCGAQTLPFSAQAAAVGLFGNFLAPGLGTAAAFGASSSLAAGQEYIDMRREGVSKETASKVSAISGGLQGLVEVALGTTTDYLAVGAGKALSKTAAAKLADKVTENVAKRFHYGAGKKLTLNLVNNWTTDKLGEGLEEAVQEVTSIVFDDVARSMDGLGLSDETIADKAKQVADAFKGGVVGAVVLGLPIDIARGNASIKDYQNVRKIAEETPSEEVFKEKVKDNPVFSEIKEEKKNEIIHEAWENVQNEMEAAELHDAKAITEVNTADESFEDIQTDEESGENDASPVVRDELTGGLIIQSDITEDDGSIKKESYRAGDNTKSEKNVYGYINATINEETKTVTIEKFSMNSKREGLREEVFDNFARDHAGYNIEWEPKLKVAKSIKENLVENNPSGKNNGLNYYNSEEEVANIQTRKEIASQIREAYSKVGKSLSNDQIAADVAVMESLYNRLGRDLKDRGVNSFSDYVNYTFGNKIFGNSEEVFESAELQGETGRIQGGSITRNLTDFDRGMKALIYVTEKGDFSTFSHEVAHIARKQLTGSLLDEAASAFDVQKDENGEYQWTQDKEEAFAYGFEKFLRTGKAKNEGLKTLFQKLAQFLNDCINALKQRVDLTPEIENVYNELLAGDKSVLAAAKRAAEQSDIEYKKQMEEESLQAKEAEKIQAEEEYKKQVEEREANAETSDYDEELESNSNVVQSNDTKESESQEDNVPKSQEEEIKQALDNTRLPEEVKNDALEILSNQDETLGAKEEVIQDVAGMTSEEGTQDAVDLVMENKEEVISQEEIDLLLNGVSSDDIAEGEDTPEMLFQTTGPQLIDLSSVFNDIKTGNITAKDIENYLNSIINQEFDTVTAPLKIRLVNKNKAHVVNGNIQLIKNQKTRHETALYKLESVINNAVKTNRDGTVDLTHNTGKALKHKQNIIKYVYFNSEFIVNNEIYNAELQAERVKGQDPSILDLYHIHVTKKGPVTATNLIALPNRANKNVISNAKKVNNITILFQTQKELYDDARKFDTWVEFMDYYQLDFDPEKLEDPEYLSQVPSGADAQWYQTTWELAKGVQPEESLNANEVKERFDKEDTTPRAMDSLFIAQLGEDNGMFEDFMHMVAYYEKLDLNSEEWQRVNNAEDAQERERIDHLKNLIEITMKSESMQRAINRIAAGGEITPDFKRRLISEMSDGFKSRDFRSLYAEIMDDKSYKVNPEDTTETLLNNKMNEINRRYNLQIPESDISKMSPQQRKELSDQLDNEEIAAKLKDGSLKMDDQVDKYIKSLKSQISNLKKEQNELKKSILEETSRLADEEQKDLLKVNEELIKAKIAYDKKNDEITRKIASGIKISKKYQLQAQNLKHDYNEILRKYKDLLITTKITGEVQRALDTQKMFGDALTNIDKLEAERTTMSDVQKLRKNLVKRTMRRVRFDTVDYENARKIIAIQRIFEPNLLGGVNKWIGQRDPYLRGVISAVVTDKDYRNELSNYIRKRATSSNAYAEFWDKWQDLITSPSAEVAIKKFNSWDEKTRKRAIMYLPKEDWIKELQLKELDKEREESIDLDIGIKERREPMRDEKGNLIYIPQYDEKGKLIKNPDTQRFYTKVIYEFDASEEIKAMIKDAVGEDIYNNLLYRPFSEWTVEEMEHLAKRVDDLYTEGRDILAARNQLQVQRAAEIRQKIEKSVKDTGIVINDDDTPEEKAKKQAKIDKILGFSDELKGTNAAKNTGIKARMNRLLHGYNDANVLRVARILDGNNEGVNVQELYRKEDDCYINKSRSINNRVNAINQVMKDNNITMDELTQNVKVGDKTFTIDELLYFAAANEDFAEDEKKIEKGFRGIDANDDYAATSRNAVMFGNLFSDTSSLEFKEECALEDEEMQRRIDADELTSEERNAQILGELVTKPGTERYILSCHEAFREIMKAVDGLDEKYKSLLKVIADDYAEQYDRMNEISIKEFNTPVHRVKCYVPLIRLESNGDTNVNQVKEDLLATFGQGAGKQWVNKGMTKRRTNMSPLNQKPVQTGLYKTWADSVERTEHFISYSAYVRELNRVYKSRDAQYIRQFIENRYGKGMLSYIDDYINEVANPNANKIREKGAELLHTLRGKTAPAYLAWKASAIIKQGLTSPWPYMQFINPAEYMKASWKCITSKGSIYEAIREKSVFMNNRVMDPMNDLIDEMAEKANQNKFEKGLNKFNKKGMAGLEWIDWVCVAPGWYACYEKKYNELVGHNQEVFEATKERLTEENFYAEVGTKDWKSSEQIEKLAQKAMEDDVETKAVQYADDCTRACQPSNRSVDISPLFKNSSEAMKAYLQFQTSLNVIWQNIRYDIPYAIKKNEFGRVAMTIVGYALAGIFMNSVMDGLGGDDDKDGSKADDRMKNLVYYATTQFTDSVPMIGSELTNTMDKLITGKASFQQSGTDMTPTATKMFAILTNAKKGNFQKAAEMTAEGFAMYLGLPVSGAKEIKKLAGVGDDDGEVGLKLGNVYGILNEEDYE